jgi:hypothetical protein
MPKQGFKFGQWIAKAGLLSAGALLPLTGSAQVSFRIDAESLKDQANNPIPVGQGLILLVASTTDSTFNDPVPGSFVTGDDVIVGQWNINEEAGVLWIPDQSFNLTGAWTENDPLGLYWYPSRTSTAGGPNVDESYGFYTDLTGANSGSDPWITPANGSPRRNLFFLTTDAPFAGNVPAEQGVASMTVVPEPSTYAMIAGLSLLGFAGYRRYRAKTA